MKVRPGAVVRGAGVALACLASSPTTRSRVLFAAYAVGWPLGKPGLQVFVVIPDTDEPWKRATVPFATSVASWSTVMLVATTALRRTEAAGTGRCGPARRRRGGRRLPPRRSLGERGRPLHAEPSGPLTEASEAVAGAEGKGRGRGRGRRRAAKLKTPLDDGRISSGSAGGPGEDSSDVSQTYSRELCRPPSARCTPFATRRSPGSGGHGSWP